MRHWIPKVARGQSFDLGQVLSIEANDAMVYTIRGGTSYWGGMLEQGIHG
jgi:hypothetical protein